MKTKTVAERFGALGFAYRETGGGCNCWELPLARGLSLTVTDDGIAPQSIEDAAALFTMTEEHSEELSVREFANTGELLDMLEASLTAPARTCAGII